MKRLGGFADYCKSLSCIVLVLPLQLVSMWLVTLPRQHNWINTFSSVLCIQVIMDTTALPSMSHVRADKKNYSDVHIPWQHPFGMYLYSQATADHIKSDQVH